MARHRIVTRPRQGFHAKPAFARLHAKLAYAKASLGGNLLLPNKSLNNIFKDLQAGIVCINATSVIRGCRFENIAFLPSNSASYQGTAITFITNFGKKSLTIVGLGKVGTPTINNCERGIYATTSSRPSALDISNCRMTEVQNGIDINATGIGNFSNGVIKDNYIGCTKYLAIIKKRSIGILWNDPSILLSNFSITGNNIDVNQPEAYPTPTGLDEEILPTGIHVVAMHTQATGVGMILDISSNRIDLIKGHQGIVVENVINATINNNNILHDNALYNPRGQVGVHVIGGLNNVVSCNTVTQTDPIGAYIVGFSCESSPGMTMARNTADNTFGSISFVNDNETNCRIQYNDLKYNLGIPNIAPTGLFYNDAQTGPQGLQGNDWIGDFGIGALYEEGDGTYPYCNSLYHVSVGANVNNAINPVAEGTPQLCGDWFTTNGSENDYTCLHILSPNSIEKNSADLNLASGGTLSLSLGYKWSSEIGLYRKFTENPSLAIGDAVINGFMQVQQSQPVATMFGVRNSINGIEGGIASTLLSSIQSVLVQLETNKTSLLSYLENIDTDPSALASFNTLYTQTEALEQLLQSYLLSASNSMALSAASVRNTNNSISSSALPCTAERYVNWLYLETQIITPRALTATELEAVRQIGLNCSKDAGSTVYLARAWYYLQTGLVLNTLCSSFMPPLDVIERNNQIQLAPRSDLVLTPNPADDNVSVNIPANLGESTMFLTDILGRLLLQRKIPESEEASILLIPTEGFANGVYWVSVKTKTRNSLTKKLVITH